MIDGNEFIGESLAGSPLLGLDVSGSIPDADIDVTDNVFGANPELYANVEIFGDAGGEVLLQGNTGLDSNDVLYA